MAKWQPEKWLGGDVVVANTSCSHLGTGPTVPHTRCYQARVCECVCSEEEEEQFRDPR